MSHFVSGDIVFVTGNQHKREQVERFLKIPLKHRALDLEELQSTDLKTIVEHKARQAYERLHVPVLVEDASLTFTAIAPLPGPFIKWFGQVGYESMCRMLDGFADRSALARLYYALYDGTSLHYFEGTMSGRIARHPSAQQGGFGFDVIFINDGFSKPRVEMSATDYSATSYRHQALQKLQTFLTA